MFRRLHHQRVVQVLTTLNPLPFKFYAVVIDKREIRRDSGLVYKDSFYKFLSGLLYKKLFGAFPPIVGWALWVLVSAALVGAIIGGIEGRTKPCPAGQTFCLNGIGIGAGGVAAIFGVGGALVGSVAGGATDMTRGSLIYTRP